MSRRTALAVVGLVACLLGLVVALVARDDAGAGGGPAPLDGAALFTAKGCATCHVTIGAGPPLVDVATWAGDRVPGLDAEAYLAESIRDPAAHRAEAPMSGALMPVLVVTDDEVDRLVAHLLER